MVQYRYALRSDGSVADAQELATQERCDVELSCLGCGQRIIAKVHGTKRLPHFSHHPGTVCNPETYLHRLGKEVFAETYRQCLATDTPFEIELLHPRICRRFEDYTGSPCRLAGHDTKRYDLTSFYDSLKLEHREGQFIPDLLLFKQNEPTRRVFVEIAVTHFLSEEKERSLERIIEIPLSSEEDLNIIRGRNLSGKSARFVNFITESEDLVDSDCECAGQMADGLFVYDSGKCTLDRSPLAVLVAKRQKFAKKVTYFRLVNVWAQPDKQSLIGSQSYVFRQAVEQAHAEGFQLRNCYLCRYHGQSFAGEKGMPIYCKYLKKSCGSNEAVDCHAFRLPEPQKASS